MVQQHHVVDIANVVDTILTGFIRNKDLGYLFRHVLEDAIGLAFGRRGMTAVRGVSAGCGCRAGISMRCGGYGPAVSIISRAAAAAPAPRRIVMSGRAPAPRRFPHAVVAGRC